MIEQSQSQWIDINKELPSHDCKVYVCDESHRFVCVMEYDGYGFIRDHKYYEPAYWKYYTKLEKRYGKVNG